MPARVISPISPESAEIRYLIGERVDSKALQSRITDVLSNIGTVDSVVDDIKGEILDSSSGLNALKILITSVQSAVSSIQNNTRMTTSIAPEVDIPETGSVYHKFFVNLYDSAGGKEDPDSEEIAVVLTRTDGTDITTDRLFKTLNGDPLDDGTLYPSNKILVRDSLGRYYFFYKSSSTDIEEVLNVQFKYKEGSVENGADRSISVVEELGRSVATASNQQLILDNIATVDTKVSSIKTKTDNLPENTATTLSNLQSSVTTVNNHVTDIKGSGFSSAEHSLVALSDKISLSAPAVFIAEKSTSSLAQGGQQTLAISTGDGFTAKKCLIKSVRVGVTGATTSFRTEIFEKTGAVSKVIDVQEADANGFYFPFDVVFVNKDTTPSNIMYVRITNVADSAESTFSVEVRGEVRS